MTAFLRTISMGNTNNNNGKGEKKMGNGKMKLEVLDKKELVEKLIDRVGCFMTHFLATFENFETKTFGFVPMNDNRFQEFRKKKDNSLTTKEINCVTCKKVYNPYLGT